MYFRLRMVKGKRWGGGVPTILQSLGCIDRRALLRCLEGWPAVREYACISADVQSRYGRKTERTGIWKSVKIAHETRYTGFLPKNSLSEVEGVGIRISIVSVTRVVQICRT